MSSVLRLGPPFDPRLLDELGDRVISWEGELWRIVLAGSDPVVANSRGARWNPPDLETLYFSLDPRVANSEIEALLSREPIPIRKERKLFRFTLKVSRVLDLRSGHGLEEFGLDADALVREETVHTQALGLAASKYLECGAVIAPSARAEGSNLALYVGYMASADELSSGEMVEKHWAR